MRKLLAVIALALSCAEPALAKTPCCTSAEVQTIGDLNYIARAQLNHTGPLRDRLYTLAMQLKAGTWRQWSDPDRGYVLGLMAATNDGLWPPNRALLDAFASELGVVIKTVTFPTPPPVVVVPPAPPPIVVNPPPAPLPSGVTVIEGDLIVKGKVCVIDARYTNDCDRTKVEAVQVLQGHAAAIGFKPNMSNEWRQADTPNGTGPGYGTIGMSPDLGLRLCQNQFWGVNGYVGPVVPIKGVACHGGDSQGTFSFNMKAVGAGDHGTQQVVLLDLPGIGLAWVVWRPGVPLCTVTSSTKWAMDEVRCPPITSRISGLRGATLNWPKSLVDSTAGMYR